ncbi:MAG: CDP-glycerol glycerophosphotransferase family protein, partial [Acutalibacteraceae bacterium]
NIDEYTAELIVNEVHEKIKLLDVRSISLLKAGHAEFSIENLCTSRAKMLDIACFTAVLYGDETNVEDFLNCLTSLTLQTLTNIKIVVPKHMKDHIIEAELIQENIVFYNVDSKDELYYKALNEATTEFIVFCDAKFVYYASTLKQTLKYFKKINPDFVAELIYHSNYGEVQPVTLNKVAFTFLKGGYKYGPQLNADYTLANKFFKVEFLRKRLDTSKSILENLKNLYSAGYYNFINSGSIIFNDLDENFLDFVARPDTVEQLKGYLTEGKNDFQDIELKARTAESYQKLQKLKNNSIKNILKNIVIYFYKNKKVKNNVLFYSIRKNGRLEGNSAALYPYIKGEKEVYAKQLPHNIFYELKMIRKIMTSKVIITDDYLRYLRNFPMKPEQRVIQVWHACGAFKKFGQRGTNISLTTDIATHAQYNLVSVSSDYVRSIYADAFDVSIKKVKALGCPSTDKFFDKSVVEKAKKKIYAKYPQFKGKSVIVYAPTFRDVGSDRTVFKPELDFDKLSNDLLLNQVLVICPHPVMKNKIVDKKYDNIMVVRDFHTDELMLISDMLITDYSSVIFEYSLLNKPITFYCYDLMSYNRDFYLNYPEDLPGEVFKNQNELTDFIKSTDRHIVSEKHQKFVEKYMSACDGNSCRKIADVINSYIGVK